MQKNEGWYRDIAHAVVEQAVSDYRRALNGKGYGKRGIRATPEDIMKDCERFFRSSYFQMLTGINGEYLIQQIRKEHEEKIRKEQVCTSN
jgi:hypothetical protein